MELKKKYVKPEIRFVTDLEVILECLHEVYGQEREKIVSGKNIQRTMIYPFLKMLADQCEGVSEEGIHTVLWEIYAETPEIEGFLEKANVILKPYAKPEKDEEDEERTEIYRPQAWCVGNTGKI